MSGYVSEALSRLLHVSLGKPKDQPYAHILPNYGTKVQYAPDDNTSRPAIKEEKIFVKQVVKTFLYYGCTVNDTISTTLSTIASEQASPTENTIVNAQKFMNYAATYSALRRCLNSFIGMVPYMGPIFVIRFATRCSTKKFYANGNDLCTVGKPETRAIFLGFELC